MSLKQPCVPPFSYCQSVLDIAGLEAGTSNGIRGFLHIQTFPGVGAPQRNYQPHFNYQVPFIDWGEVNDTATIRLEPKTSQ